MKEELVLFQKFRTEKLAIDFSAFLDDNGIEYLVENISVNFDPILSNNEFGKEFCVKIKKNDFEKANSLLEAKAKSEISEVDNDYYLLNFSNEELIDVVAKSDEWNKFDVELSYKLLKERGKEVTARELNEIKKQRIAELSKPEAGQSIYIIIGYISAVLGGLLGVFIGWHLLSYKKTLPNGNRIYAYSQNDRKHGNRILIIGIIFIAIWVLFYFLK